MGSIDFKSVCQPVHLTDYLKSILRRCGPQLLYLRGHLAIIHVNPINLRERLYRLIEFAHFLVADSDLKPQSLIFVLESIGYFESALEPHYRDRGDLLPLEAHAQHVTTMYAVACQVYGAGCSER